MDKALAEFDVQAVVDDLLCEVFARAKEQAIEALSEEWATKLTNEVRMADDNCIATAFASIAEHCQNIA